MRVAELMQKDVRTVPDDATITEAVTAFADGHVSGLPVVDGVGRVVGVISTTDILEAEAETESTEERDRLFEKTLVREIMTAHAQVIGPEAEVREAAKQMLRQEVHRLFVEEKGRLVGVLSQTDIVRAVATSKV